MTSIINVMSSFSPLQTPKQQKISKHQGMNMVLPGKPESHLHPHHKPLPAEFQSTPEGRKAADEFYASKQSSTMDSSKLSIEDTLPLTNSTHRIPRLGFGLYLSPPTVSTESCLTALRSGYRHIDSAQYYQNESEMGAAVRASGFPRSEVFLCTKVLSPGGSPEKTYQKLLDSVKKIGGEAEGTDGEDKAYVDLFLIHSPHAGAKARKEMWQGLERLFDEGRAKAIGVSNFGVGAIEEMREWAKVFPPMVNQIELHPWCQQRTIVDYCKKNNMVIEAYAPLVRNQKAHDQTLVKISEKLHRSTAQVLIRYSLQKGWVSLPKSDTPSRITANADIYEFELSGEDMQALDALDQGDDGSIVEAVKN